MAGGVTDVLQVVVLSPGPDRLLGTGGPGVAPVFQAEEAVLELDHPRIGKKEGRIVLGDQARTRHDGVPVALEESQKLPSYFTCRHRHARLPPPHG